MTHVQQLVLAWAVGVATPITAGLLALWLVDATDTGCSWECWCGYETGDLYTTRRFVARWRWRRHRWLWPAHALHRPEASR